MSGTVGVDLPVTSPRYGIGSKGPEKGVHARTLGYSWGLRGVRGQDPSALSIDESLEERGPALDRKAEKKGAHLVPQATHRMVFV